MARPLRVLLAGGWYHVTSRGNRREALFRTDRDRHRFLGLVAELPERFRSEIHALVLMDNHDYPWSSWRVYSGAERCPDWLETGVVAGGCGGRKEAAQRADGIAGTDPSGGVKYQAAAQGV